MIKRIDHIIHKNLITFLYNYFLKLQNIRMQSDFKKHNDNSSLSEKRLKLLNNSFHNPKENKKQFEKDKNLENICLF